MSLKCVLVKLDLLTVFNAPDSIFESEQLLNYDLNKLVWTNLFFQQDICLPCSKTPVVRHVNPFLHFWSLRRYLFCVTKILKRNRSRYCLLFSDNAMHFPIIYYFAKKYLFYYSLGWLPGLWSNRPHLYEFVLRHKLTHRFYLSFKPPAISLIFSSQTISSLSYFNEISNIGVMNLSFFSSFDDYQNLELNLLNSPKTLSAIYFYMNFFFLNLSDKYHSVKLLRRKKKKRGEG